jgi:hypothetical protein
MNTIQAVVKTTYTKNPKAAKASVRYYAHRIDREGNRTTRQLFGNYGLLTKNEAYRLIDSAKGRTYFYRIIISPENSEGMARDLASITRQAMRDLQKTLRTKRPIPFVAAVHTDHSDTPHVHALAILKTYLGETQLAKLRQSAEEAVIAEGYARSSAAIAKTQLQYAATKLRFAHSENRQLNIGNHLKGDIFVANRFPSVPVQARSLTIPSKRIFVCPACREPSSLRKIDTYFECKNCGMEIGRPRQLTLSQSLSYQGGESYS